MKCLIPILLLVMCGCADIYVEQSEDTYEPPHIVKTDPPMQVFTREEAF